MGDGRYWARGEVVIGGLEKSGLAVLSEVPSHSSAKPCLRKRVADCEFPALRIAASLESIMGGSMNRILALAAVLLVSIGAAPSSYKVVPVQNGGWISGRISYVGQPVKRKEIMPTVDAPVCGQHGLIPSDELVTSATGGLQYAVVRLTNITAGRPASDLPPVLLVQKGCMFSPHVFAVSAGTTVRERNEDGILHNVHTHSSRNPPVNFAHTPAISEMPLTSFPAQESVKVTCDVHGWMSAWIWVSPHPYIVVTGADGTYKIPGVPAGQYRLEVWHESLGKVSHEVTVAAGKETRIDLSLPAPSPSTRTAAKK